PVEIVNDRRSRGQNLLLQRSYIQESQVTDPDMEFAKRFKTPGSRPYNPGTVGRPPGGVSATGVSPSFRHPIDKPVVGIMRITGAGFCPYQKCLPVWRPCNAFRIVPVLTEFGRTDGCQHTSIGHTYHLQLGKEAIITTPGVGFWRRDRRIAIH